MCQSLSSAIWYLFSICLTPNKQFLIHVVLACECSSERSSYWSSSLPLLLVNKPLHQLDRWPAQKLLFLTSDIYSWCVSCGWGTGVLGQSTLPPMRQNCLSPPSNPYSSSGKSFPGGAVGSGRYLRLSSILLIGLTAQHNLYI